MSRATHLTCNFVISPITSQYGFAKINKGVYAHPQFRRGDKEGLTQLRKRVKAASTSRPSSNNNKITQHRPSSPSGVASSSSSRLVSPPMSPTHEPLEHQPHHDASSERLLILAQAVRVAMILDAGRESTNVPSPYC